MQPISRRRVPIPQTASPMAGFLRPSVGTAIFVTTVVAFLGTTVWLAAILNLYIDEAYSLHTTDRGVGYAFQQSLDFEQQPPLYFVALALWRSLDHGILFARLTSIACAVATLFVVRDFTRRQLRNLPDWLPPLLLATNPFAIWAALELRVYALIVLLSASLVSLFFRAFIDERRSRRLQVAFVGVAVAALYTQYFFVATLIGFGAIVLVFRRRCFVEYACAAALAIATLAPMVSIVRLQMHDASVETVARPLDLALAMLTTVATFVLPHDWINALHIRAINVLYTILFVFVSGLAAIGIKRNREVLVLSVLVGTLLAFFGSLIIVGRDPIEMPRHITTLFVPTMLMAIAAISSSFSGPRRRNLLLLYLGIYEICAGTELVHTYRPLAKVGDWIRVSRYLAQNVAATEPIATFDTENALPLRYYYYGPSRIVPIPREQRFDRFQRSDFAFTDRGDVVRTFPHPAPTSHVVWLVIKSPCRYVQLGESCALLDEYVRSNFEVLRAMPFYQTTVFELRPKSTRNSRFRMPDERLVGRTAAERRASPDER